MKHIEHVLDAIPSVVSRIYCVDDACPDHSGDYIAQLMQKYPRVRVLKRDHNGGVGAAVMTGYQQALEDGAEIIVKIDGDGQMNPSLIPNFINPILSGQCDYTKGNRFYYIEDVLDMPFIRILGNAVLSFITKLSAGYWTVFDPTNGYTAIHRNVLSLLPFEKIAKRYFFESDMLFRLNLVRAVVQDIPMRAIYGDEVSHLHVSKILFPFLKGHVRNFIKRIIYNYFLRDFHIASVQLFLGIFLLLFGVTFGIDQWLGSIETNKMASAGTVMISALPIIIGIQFLVSFLHFDIQSVPRFPIVRHDTVLLQ